MSDYVILDLIVNLLFSLVSVIGIIITSVFTILNYSHRTTKKDYPSNQEK